MPKERRGHYLLIRFDLVEDKLDTMNAFKKKVFISSQRYLVGMMLAETSTNKFDWGALTAFSFAHFLFKKCMVCIDYLVNSLLSYASAHHV